VDRTGGIDAAVAYLLTPAAIRERAHSLLRLAEQDALPHFLYRADRLPAAADYVLETIRANYPDLRIPFHSRWRHFSVGGVDRWQRLSKDLAGADAAERARIRFDLAVTSVLLDAGAGAAWRYAEPGGAEYARSEGLAVASLQLFRAGAFSDDPSRPWRADATALAGLDERVIAEGFQVSAANPFLGLEGRAALMRRLGTALAASPALFGTPGRFGTLFDHLARSAVGDAIPAKAILDGILRGLGGIWPGRHVLGGVNLGDVWRHSLARARDASDGYVPFHKLSQWLAYSLIEPIEEAGLRVVEIDALTGLAEYRNGGFIIDVGLIEPRDPELRRRPLAAGAEPVVEWRTLTVALLDRIAERVRGRLAMTAETLPLAKVLEGGTWAAGRRIAAALRPGGPPPLTFESDGTVF
jgi:hypothetical protein